MSITLTDYKEMKSRLRDLNGYITKDRGVRGGEALVPVKRALKKPEILSLSERPVPVLSNIVSDSDVIFQKGLCAIPLFPGCWTVTKFVNPTITYVPIPYVVKNLTFYLSKFQLIGNLTLQLKNNSKEGKKCQCRAFLGRCDPMQNCRTESGSASFLKSKMKNEWQTVEKVRKKMGTTLHNITQKINPGFKASTTAVFKTTGLQDLFWSAVELFRSGRVVTSHGIDVTVDYQFRGKRFSKRSVVKGKYKVPVSGNLTIKW